MNNPPAAGPTWLGELEAKRERRLKARLGHEAGAGSACLVCKDNCPGLDLHFWRKICKNCKCGKENHDVIDDDISGLAQFQLLGKKPTKTNREVHGKDEVLEWVPKGTKEAVEHYLKTLPPELLPIKGSSAAQERKQLLQKQMPIHDIDPTLCHALTEEETNQMNEYINSLKENSVGVGKLTQIKRSGTLDLDKLSLKHDYENIDAFGKHKLAASLEEIERMQQFHNPASAQYGMLLDKSGLPIKDKQGVPIKSALDIFGNPVFDAAIVEKIGPLAKAEYAILLDRHGAPVLNSNGGVVKNAITYRNNDLIDKTGNKPAMGLLVNKNCSAIKDPSGNPIKLNLDVFNVPIIPRAMVSLVNASQPKYSCFLDKKGTPMLDSLGQLLKYDLGCLKGPNYQTPFKYERPSKFALLLDKNKKPIKCKNNSPISTKLDHFGAPVLDDYIIEKLNNQLPQFAILLDKNGVPILDQLKRPKELSLSTSKPPIYDKFGKEIKPQYGLLLDENEMQIKDVHGSPVKVRLDAFRRPIINESIVERMQNQKPEYSMLLDVNGAPILDKYGSPIKDNVYFNSKEPHQAVHENTPKLGMLLDANGIPLKDQSGHRIKANLDSIGRPIIAESILEQLAGQHPVHALLLDRSGAPILDQYGNPTKRLIEDVSLEQTRADYGMLLDKSKSTIPNGKVGLDAIGRPIITDNLLDSKPDSIMMLDQNGIPAEEIGVPQVRDNIYDKFGNVVKPQYGLLLDTNQTPIRDAVGSPVSVKLDKYGRPEIDESVLERIGNKQPQYLTLLDRNGAQILDKYLSPIVEKISPQFQSKPHYALLLDSDDSPITYNSVPIKVNLDNLERPVIDAETARMLDNRKPESIMFLDKIGAPVLDQFNSPVIESLPVLKIAQHLPSTMCKGEALLLDKNNMPLKDITGTPIKVPVDSTGQPIMDENALERLGNQEVGSYKFIDPDQAFGVVLDANKQIIRDIRGNPVTTGLDALRRPIIDDSTKIKLANANPSSIMLLDGKGAPMLDVFATPIILDYPEAHDDNALCGLGLDKNGAPLHDAKGEPIEIRLDAIKQPIIDHSTLDLLENVKLDAVMLIDRAGKPLADQYGYPVVEKINAPKYGLLLDKNDAPITDISGKNVKVPLDSLNNPIVNRAIVDRLQGNPEAIMLLDPFGTPILDKYNNPITKPLSTPNDIKDKFGNVITPQFGLLLDKNSTPIKDQNGSPVKVEVDALKHPIVDQNTLRRLQNQQPESAMLLDRNGAPILDKYGNVIKENLNGSQELQDKYGNKVDVDNTTLLDRNGRPILNEHAAPFKIKMDGNNVFLDSRQPLLGKNGKPVDLDKATVLGKQGLPLLDSSGFPVRLNVIEDGVVSLHKTGQPIFDSDGNILIQPQQKLQNFYPQSNNFYEDNSADPIYVNVGSIQDISYDTLKNTNDNSFTYPENLSNYDTTVACHRCKKILEDQEVAIQTERSDAYWHAGCFKCAGCNQSLADLVYLYDKKSDNIYCLRDYAKIRGIPRCNACDELIFTKHYCLTEDQTYHLKHFCCFECDKELAGQNYIMENNQPICLSCSESKCDKCAACGLVVAGQGVNLNGTHFHANDECFCCKTCQKPLLATKMLFKNLKLYCSAPCYQKDM